MAEDWNYNSNSGWDEVEQNNNNKAAALAGGDSGEFGNGGFGCTSGGSGNVSGSFGSPKSKNVVTNYSRDSYKMNSTYTSSYFNSNSKSNTSNNNNYYNNSNNNNSNTSGGGSGWKPKIKNWQQVGNLNKMIAVHNLPFFDQTQSFMGKTVWDLLKRSKANFSDVIDRLNCYIVPVFLLFFVMAISMNIFGTFGMEPMRCLRSPDLNDEEREYALDYCQSKNTYYVAPDEGIPWSNKDRRERQLGYYHWVPIMMFLQAMLFMLPNWLWNGLNQQSGIEFIKFIEESYRVKPMGLDNPERAGLVKVLADKIAEAILNHGEHSRRRLFGCRFGQIMGSYVSWLYVFIKALYLINVSGQFFLLNSFIGSAYRWWGLDVFNALLAGENWQDSPIFPRLTLCDVPIRRLGDTPRYTLQCHLRINTYNEKIYLFIWWGFLLVAVLTFFNFCYYLLVLLCLPCTQENSVRHLLKQRKFEHIVYSSAAHHRKLIKDFAENTLCKDGVLLFWFIESHAGPIIARDLFGEMFKNFLNKPRFEDCPDMVKVVQKIGGDKASFSSLTTSSLKEDINDEDNGVKVEEGQEEEEVGQQRQDEEEREEENEKHYKIRCVKRGSCCGGGGGGEGAKKRRFVNENDFHNIHRDNYYDEQDDDDHRHPHQKIYEKRKNVFTRLFRFFFGVGSGSGYDTACNNNGGQYCYYNDNYNNNNNKQLPSFATSADGRNKANFASGGYYYGAGRTLSTVKEV